MRHVMIDLETLGTGDFAPIVQIGAVRFDADRVGRKWRQNILARDWSNIDGDTLLWWMRQDPEARARVFDQSEAMPLAAALHKFGNWLKSGGPVDTAWADSPSFDLRLLRQAWRRAGMVEPWPFTHRQERDLRTLKKLYGAETVEPQRGEGELVHDGADDAAFQARWVQGINRCVARIF